MSVVICIMCDLCGEIQKTNCDEIEQSESLQSKGETKCSVYAHLCLDCRNQLRKDGDLEI
jgi:hypothetical protein